MQFAVIAVKKFHTGKIEITLEQLRDNSGVVRQFVVYGDEENQAPATGAVLDLVPNGSRVTTKD